MSLSRLQEFFQSLSGLPFDRFITLNSQLPPEESDSEMISGKIQNEEFNMKDIESNFTNEELALMKTLKNIWVCSMTRKQKIHYDKIYYYYDIITQNIGKNPKDFVFTTKYKMTISQKELTVIKRELGLIDGNTAEYKQDKDDSLLHLINTKIINVDLNETVDCDAILGDSFSSIKDIDIQKAISKKITKESNYEKCIPPQIVFECAYWYHAKGTNHARRDSMIQGLRKKFGYYWGDRPLVKFILAL